MFVCEEIPQAENDNAVSRSDRNKNAPERTCVGCGVTFRRKGNSKDAAKYCSRECAFGNLKRIGDNNRSYAAAYCVSYSVIRCECVDCASWFSSNSIQTQRCEDCSAVHRRARQDKRRGLVRSPRKCPECNNVFVPQYGRGQAIYCSNECSSSKNKRVSRTKRRARIREAANDNLDPFVVFDRDGWRCQFCNVRTPRKLRGTHEPNAPEIDHIVPLSRGGGHTYINTQCLCRSCNGLKSNNIVGQLRMFG